VAASVALYATFCVPFVNEVVVTIGDATTVRVSGAAAFAELASATCTVKLPVPVAVGVPEIAPVLGVSVNPVGKDPEVIDQV
jgi:hypothetical protein